MSKPRKNRRVSRKQHHVLDVNVRQGIARTQRQRAILWLVCRVIVVTSAIAGIWIGGKEAMRRFVWENPDYFLSDVKVEGNFALTRDQVLATGGIEIGRNIFNIDMAKAREALDALPQVERVELQRLLPNRIVITITERKPIAWLVRDGAHDVPGSDKSFLVDARGVVMRNKTMIDEYLRLPVISGVEVENLTPGGRVRTCEMLAALDLIRYTGANTRFQPRLLNVKKGYCVVVTDQNRRKITFGVDAVDEQVEHLMRFLDYTEKEGKEIRAVNFLVKTNTPVIYSDDVPETPDSAAPQKPVTPREKDAKAKATPAAIPKKIEAPSTPTAPPATTPPKPAVPSTPTLDSIKKPFRLNG